MTQKRNRRASVEDRWTKTFRDGDGNNHSVPSANHGKGMRWRARYVDDNDGEHASGFRTKAEATSWLNEVVSTQVTGTYVDPVLGKVTFASFYRDWSSGPVWETGTRHTMDLSANSVTFGNAPLVDLRKSHVELWVK